MKKILLMGDCICVGYREYVEKNLYGWADVIYPYENVRFSTYLLRYLPVYKKKMKLCGEDVAAVVFNVGLWDAVRIDGELLVPKEVYVDNIRRIIEVLRKDYPKAEIFFATTTYPRYDCEQEPGAYRMRNDVIEYNDIAMEVINKQEQVRLIDFWKTAESVLCNKYVDDIHFDEEGYKFLAEIVVDEIKKYTLIENKLNLMWGKELFDDYVLKDVDILFEKKIAIYGAGNYGRKCIKELSEKGIECMCFIDGNPEKIGTKIEDVNVLGIDEYEKSVENSDEEMIIVGIKDFSVVGDVITMLKNRKHNCICSMSIFNYI